jgi:hypothetical protein
MNLPRYALNPLPYPRYIQREIFLRHEPCPWEANRVRPTPDCIALMPDDELFQELLKTEADSDSLEFARAVTAALTASPDPRELIRDCEREHFGMLHRLLQILDHDLIAGARDDTYEHLKRRSVRIALQEIERIDPAFVTHRIHWLPEPSIDPAVVNTVDVGDVPW